MVFPTEQESTASGRSRAKSCENCRKRKVKCDRTYPCATCTVHGDNCCWATGTRPARSQSTSSDGVKQEEVMVLNAVVLDLSSRLGISDGEVEALKDAYRSKFGRQYTPVPSRPGTPEEAEDYSGLAFLGPQTAQDLPLGDNHNTLSAYSLQNHEYGYYLQANSTTTQAFLMPDQSHLLTPYGHSQSLPTPYTSATTNPESSSAIINNWLNDSGIPNAEGLQYTYRSY